MEVMKRFGRQANSKIQRSIKVQPASTTRFRVQPAARLVRRQGEGVTLATARSSKGVISLVGKRILCNAHAMQTVQLEEAQAHLSELIEDVARGNEVLIARGNLALAKLVAPGGVIGRPEF